MYQSVLKKFAKVSKENQCDLIYLNFLNFYFQGFYLFIVSLFNALSLSLSLTLLPSFLFLTLVDGCEPPSSQSHHNRPTSHPGSHHQSRIGSPSSQSQSPPTTLLQNILQQNRNSNIYSSLQRGVQNGQLPLGQTTSNTSPLPPSPADSGVSDVDSHYSSNDEQQQALNQYGYFYTGAHRSTTCKLTSYIDTFTLAKEQSKSSQPLQQKCIVVRLFTALFLLSFDFLKTTNAK